MNEKIIKNVIENKMVKNFLMIFSGEGIGSVFGFLATIFIINTVGSYNHGILVGVQTYANLFYGLFSFKTFQSLIKYLARSEFENNVTASKLYIKWSLILDVICLMLTCFFGLVLKKYVINLMGWDTNISKYCVIYLFIYLLNFQGTTIGVLRYFENFHYVVKANITCAFIRCLGFFISFLFKLDFISFFIFDCLGNIVKFLMMDYFTLITLKDHNLLDFYKIKLEWCSEFLKFSFLCNLTSTIDLPVNQITTLIINKYLGFEATSVYNVFGSLGSVINKLGDPISQIIYPEMNQRISRKDIKGAKKLSSKVKKLMLILFITSSLFVLVTGKFWLHLFISNPNNQLIPLILYLGYICYCNASMGTHNLFLALGYVKYNIPILIIVNIFYLCLLLFTVKRYALVGVILTYALQALMVVICKEFIMRVRNYVEIA